jgi:hypothetical protein
VLIVVTVVILRRFVLVVPDGGDRFVLAPA